MMGVDSIIPSDSIFLLIIGVTKDMFKLKCFPDWIFFTSLFFIVMIILFLMGFSFGAGFELLRRVIR